MARHTDPPHATEQRKRQHEVIVTRIEREPTGLDNLAGLVEIRHCLLDSDDRINLCEPVNVGRRQVQDDALRDVVEHDRKVTCSIRNRACVRLDARDWRLVVIRRHCEKARDALKARSLLGQMDRMCGVIGAGARDHRYPLTNGTSNGFGQR